MQTDAIALLKRTWRRHRTTIWEGILLLAVMAVAVLIAYEYDIFPNPPGVPTQEHVIEADEALALATLLCLGLLALSWHFLLLQRREVARRIEAEQRAHELAMQDALTGLPNRRQFDQELKDALAALPRSHGAHAVFLLDVNAFKRVNDLYGHGIGDEVLINIAMRLRRAARQEDMVARFGGDEFAILACELTGSEDATNIALRVIKELDQPIATGSLKHHVGVSIGIALIPEDGSSEVEVLRKADIALYRAKDEKPRSASRFFDAEMDARTQERDLIERDLPSAIAKGGLRCYYQPLIDLRTKQIAGFEALARWQHPTLGEVPPDRFIPVAESCGLMNELTDRLLRQAARDAAKWPENMTSLVQHFAVATQGTDPGAAYSEHHRGSGPLCPPSRDRAHRVRLLCATSRAPRLCSEPCGVPGYASRSTISAPAIPASITCATSRSTRSRSIAVSSTIWSKSRTLLRWCAHCWDLAADWD